MTESLKTHPMPGWFSFVEIPGSTIKPQSEAPPEEILDAMSEAMGVPRALVEQIADRAAPGFMAALVIEVGFQVSEDGEKRRPPLPWGEGDTVYLGSDRGIPIGDYRFATVDKPVSYKLADEE